MCSCRPLRSDLPEAPGGFGSLLCATVRVKEPVGGLGPRCPWAPVSSGPGVTVPPRTGPCTCAASCPHEERGLCRGVRDPRLHEAAQAPWCLMGARTALWPRHPRWAAVPSRVGRVKVARSPRSPPEASRARPSQSNHLCFCDGGFWLGVWPAAPLGPGRACSFWWKKCGGLTALGFRCCLLWGFGLHRPHQGPAVPWAGPGFHHPRASVQGQTPHLCLLGWGPSHRSRPVPPAARHSRQWGLGGFTSSEGDRQDPPTPECGPPTATDLQTGCEFPPSALVSPHPP